MTTNANTATAVDIDFATITPDDMTTAYRAADVAGKAAYRSAIADAIKSAIMAGDIDAAQKMVAVQNAMTTAPKSTATVDYLSKVRDLRATLVRAVELIDAGDFILPEGVSVDRSVDDTDLSGGTVDAKMADRMVTITGRKAGRGSVIDYIDSVLGDDPMTIADMRKAWSASDDYPKAPPSAGAIGAALDRVAEGADAPFTVTTIDGVKAATPRRDA